MPKVSNTPKNLRPYLFHCVSFSRQEEDEWTGDCPFCGREGKFGVNVETSMYHCVVCDAKGNSTKFLRELWENSDRNAKAAEELKESRKMLNMSTLDSWGLRTSITSGDWIFPAYGPKGSLDQLYVYREWKKGEKKQLRGTSEVSHGLFGLPLFDPGKGTVYICESWNAPALWEILKITKRTADGEYKVTGNEALSLLSNSSVIGVPGANVWKEKWNGLLADKDVVLMIDHDLPTSNGNDGAGIAGAKRTASLLSLHPEPPKSISYLNWDKVLDGLPGGYDVRDYLGEYATAKERASSLKFLLAAIEPIPEEWIEGRSKSTSKDGGVHLEPMECQRWTDLLNAWKKAMKWTGDLEHMLSVFLASVVSTETRGEQIWVLAMAPPSCLDGDTPIYDPNDNSLVTVSERYKKGEPFFVYTRKKSCIGISQALPPQKHQAVPMYEVTFSSGQTMRVTAGHRFWTGDGYVALHVISEALRQSASYPLPTISGSDLLTRMQDAHHSLRTIQDFQLSCYVCSCPDDVLPLQGSNICRCVPPSQVDAQVRIRHDFDMDGRVLEDKCNLQHADHLSIHDEPHLVESLHCEASNGFSSVLDTSVSSFLLSQTAERFLGSTNQIDTEQPSDLSFLATTSQTVYQLQQLIEHETQSAGKFQGLHCIDLPYAQPDNTQQSAYISLQMETYASQDGFVHQPLSEEFGVLPDLSEVLYNTQQKSFQTGTIPQHVLQGSSAWSSPIWVNKIDLGTNILPTFDQIVKVEYIGDREYYDFHVPETKNYWACGVFHHNSGKTTLCEALAVSREFVHCKSELNKVYSGFKNDKEGTEDFSIIPKIHNKTLIVMDGDAVLKDPNRGKILAQYRGLFDGVGRSHFNNGVSREYTCRFTFILCGTASMREMDASEVGARFINCSFAEHIDPVHERDVNRRVAYRELRNVKSLVNGSAATRTDPDMVLAKRMTGGYVEYLRRNAEEILDAVEIDDNRIETIIGFGEFVAFMRARQPKFQDEVVEREFSSRLVAQYIRLTVCLAAVLGKKVVDQEVVERVRRTALDTARGRTLNYARLIFKAGEKGTTTNALHVLTGESDDKVKGLLGFLEKIGVAYKERSSNLVQSPWKWKLTQRVQTLYEEVCQDAEG